jgi:hypothetical protein
MSMEKNFGIVCTIKVHLANDDEEGQECVVDFDHGINQVPTRAEVEAYHQQALSTVSESFPGTWRLATLEDRGYAEPNSLKWRPE